MNRKNTRCACKGFHLTGNISSKALGSQFAMDKHIIYTSLRQGRNYRVGFDVFWFTPRVKHGKRPTVSDVFCAYRQVLEYSFRSRLASSEEVVTPRTKYQQPRNTALFTALHLG